MAEIKGSNLSRETLYTMRAKLQKTVARQTAALTESTNQLNAINEILSQTNIK